MQTIKISLLKKESDINEENHTAEYTKLVTSSIDCTKIKKSESQRIPELCQGIFEEMLSLKLNDLATHVGIWIYYKDGKIIENAIDLNVLESIKKYGNDIKNSFVEFFNWTIENPE